MTISFSYSCEKREKVVPSTDHEHTISNTTSLDIWRGKQSCKLKNGKSGTRCAQTDNDESCEIESKCTSTERFTHYTAALQAMFTQPEIDQREISNTPITEPQLLEALQEDGDDVIYPVIQH